jgi:hypothetical protein
MAISDWQMNRFEQILFRVALVLALLVIAVRLGFVVVVGYMHHIR